MAVRVHLRLALALPTEGDPLGVGGPGAAAAYDAREAAVALGKDMAFVPLDDGWDVVAGHRAPVPDLGEADRGLRAALRDAALRLAQLDVARWRPEAADALMNLRHQAVPDHPSSLDPRCVDLARALQASAIVDLALVDDGAAVSAYELDARRSALTDLDRAARRGLVAACSPDAWPG